MNFRPLLSLLALCGSVLGLASCTIFEPGGPSAAITVRARSSFQVSDVIERVFIDEGYQPIQRSQDGITFERNASKTDRVLYGDWLQDDIAQRVRVTIAARGDETYRLRCLPSVVRDAHDVSFEDSHRRLEVFSFRYSRLLREARKQCEELWHSRGPDPADASG